MIAALALALAAPPAPRPGIEAVLSDVEREALGRLPDARSRARLLEGAARARGGAVPGLDAAGVAGGRRGRILLLLGAPAERLVYDHEPDLLPIEHWSYEDVGRPGLPGFFDAIFFLPEAAADFRLFDPAEDDPVLLVPGAASRAAALAALRRTSPSLADAAAGGAGFDRLGARLEELADRLPLEASYLLDPGLGPGLIPLAVYAQGAFGAGDAGLLHFGVELPQGTLGLSPAEGKWTGALRVVGGVFAADGVHAVAAIEGQVDIALDDDLHESLRDFPFAFEDRIELLPGTYRLTLVVKDLTTGESGIASACVEVPAWPSAGIQMGPLLLASRAVPAEGNTARPFTFGGRTWHPARDARFAAGSTLLAAFEVAGEGELQGPLALRYQVLAGSEAVLTGFDRLDGAASAEGVAVGALQADLGPLAPGAYGLEIEIGGGAAVARGSAAFSVTAGALEASPWILVRRRPSAPSERALALASQYLVKGEPERGAAWLEVAARDETAPEMAAEARLRLAALRLRLGDPASAAAAVADSACLPGLVLLARARSALADHDQALATYGRALALAPKSRRVLDAMVEEHRLASGASLGARR